MIKQTERAAEWLYHGLWQILVTWFVVPRDPPQLPVRPGDRVESFRPALGFLRYLKFWFWLALALIDGALLIIWLVILVANVFWGLVLAPLFFIVAVVPDIIAYIAIHLRYDTTWYLLSSRSLRIRRGIWVIREMTVTFENVQDVTVRQGPVERLFGIAQVTVKTAGGGGGGPEHAGPDMHSAVIEGIDDAQRIRDLIMNKVRQSQTAGLGDEPIAVIAPPRAMSGWLPQHVELLRQIRDELRVLVPSLNLRPATGEAQGG